MRRRQGPMWVSAPTGGYIPRRTRQRETTASAAAAGPEAEALAESSPKFAPTGQMRHRCLTERRRIAQPDETFQVLSGRTVTRAASPNLTLYGSSLDKERFSFGPCTARFLWQDQRGPRRSPAERVRWGEEKETERCEFCPTGRNECSAVSFDDNGGCISHASLRDPSLPARGQTSSVSPAGKNLRPAPMGRNITTAARSSPRSPDPAGPS